MAKKTKKAKTKTKAASAVKMTDAQQEILEQHMAHYLEAKQLLAARLARLQETVALIGGVGAELSLDPDGRPRITAAADD